jgi:hypothetical protein
VPISLISSIFGMNVSQITADDSNPSIWLFFVGTVALNFFIASVLTILNWLHIRTKHNRTPGVKESFGFAVGR